MLELVYGCVKNTGAVVDRAIAMGRDVPNRGGRQGLGDKSGGGPAALWRAPTNCG